MHVHQYNPQQQRSEETIKKSREKVSRLASVRSVLYFHVLFSTAVQQSNQLCGVLVVAGVCFQLVLLLPPPLLLLLLLLLQSLLIFDAIEGSSQYQIGMFELRCGVSFAFFSLAVRRQRHDVTRLSTDYFLGKAVDNCELQSSITVKIDGAV